MNGCANRQWPAHEPGSSEARLALTGSADEKDEAFFGKGRPVLGAVCGSIGGKVGMVYPCVYQGSVQKTPLGVLTKKRFNIKN